MKIATYNINGIRGRLPELLTWLDEAAPDVVCLQELKSSDAGFPRAALERVGYRAVFVGQRAYNGVAILARAAEPLLTRRTLPGDEHDAESRYVEAAVRGVLIACVYAPNGNPQPGPRFTYKLAWLARLCAHAEALRAAGVPVVLAGDFNVVPTERDIYPGHASYKRDALVQPESRAAYARLLAQGWTDSLRAHYPDEPALFTFWDYKRDAFPHDRGMRLDHLLLSPDLARRLCAAGVDRVARARPGASDHAPTWIVLEDVPPTRARSRR